LAANQEAEFHFISRSVIREFYSKDLIGSPIMFLTAASSARFNTVPNDTMRVGWASLLPFPPTQIQAVPAF
jgi:hypothetical protein